VDASWVAAIASVASALVVGVAAIAALLQIRHIRNANDITTYLRLVERLDSPKSRAAFDSIPPLVEQLGRDASLRSRLARTEPIPEVAEVVELVRFLNNLTMLILIGGVSERLILAEYADDIVLLWNSLAEVIYLRRPALGVRFGAALEHLAMRAKTHLERGDIDRFYGRLLRDPRMSGFTAPES
jgi:hypothetical protein